MALRLQIRKLMPRPGQQVDRNYTDPWKHSRFAHLDRAREWRVEVITVIERCHIS